MNNFFGTKGEISIWIILYGFIGAVGCLLVGYQDLFFLAMWVEKIWTYALWLCLALVPFTIGNPLDLSSKQQLALRSLRNTAFLFPLMVLLAFTWFLAVCSLTLCDL
jgi:hypothetical protein